MPHSRADAAPLRGLLFDKDGTLFDFQATWAGVTEALLLRLSADAETRATLARIGGFDTQTRRFRAGSAIVAGATRETAALWAPLLPGATVAGIERLMNVLSQEMVGPDALVTAVPDLPAYLLRLRGLGYRLGVATHDSEAGARSQLAAVGALEFFDFIAGYDSGHGLKPGPGMLDAFACATGLQAAEIAMIGDSVHDLMVVPNAGAAFSVGVLTGPACAADLEDHADHVLASIADLPGLLAALSAMASVQPELPGSA